MLKKQHGSKAVQTNATPTLAPRSGRARRTFMPEQLLFAAIGAVVLAAVTATVVFGVRALGHADGAGESALLSRYRAPETAVAPDMAEANAALSATILIPPETVEQTEAAETAEDAAETPEPQQSDLIETPAPEQPRTPTPTATPDAARQAALAEVDQLVSEMGAENMIGVIEIVKTGQIYPIIGDWSYPRLKRTICRYTGGMPNEAGENLVLLGHNYKNGTQFGKLASLDIGDEILLTATDDEPVRYEIYEMEGIRPDNFAALEKWSGPAGLTLLTCKDSGKNRLVVRCRQKAPSTRIAADMGMIEP